MSLESTGPTSFRKRFLGPFCWSYQLEQRTSNKTPQLYNYFYASSLAPLALDTWSCLRCKAS